MGNETNTLEGEEIAKLIKNANKRLMEVYTGTPLINVKELVGFFMDENRKCLDILAGKCEKNRQRKMPRDIQNMDHLVSAEEIDVLSLSSVMRFAEKIEADLIRKVERLAAEQKTGIDQERLSLLMTSLQRISRKISILYDEMIQKQY